MLFPEIFPYGRRGFQLYHHKKKLRAADQEWNEVYTLKEYCKYRLRHFERTVALNHRFITFFYDWVMKDATGGYKLRTTTTSHAGGHVTTQRNVLQG